MPIQPIDNATTPGNGPIPKAEINSKRIITSGKARSIVIKNLVVFLNQAGARFAAAASAKINERTDPKTVAKKAKRIVSVAGLNISEKALKSGGNMNVKNLIAAGIPALRSLRLTLQDIPEAIAQINNSANSNILRLRRLDLYNL
jgi:hypothetical protein